ncbi:uncharacterized protein PITG_06190 [Phytophthora infestans T30-4]|uniref:Uncharacterized protein n=1 Tax=Phytophthora infestans (strain T30-4) TaxID=403677 RepID=D0N4A6_PHYIT|nr:uncharacterized protein PITG_06190 [Phytophthora infestans T30-4]EEY69714.1 conserved hypothetical protein [Phytophthora infestans T30-4]|eukprot:XP_002998361.1 conserved hypothetical protein [Phytophthora infestans T30-4]
MDSWRVLFPWCKWLRGHSCWLLVTLPKHQRNASSDLLPKIRESLILLSIVAAADHLVFCDILRETCGVDGDLNKFDSLRVIFVLDDHTSRSLLWPETVYKALLAWDGDTIMSEEFLLVKEELKRIAEKKLGIIVPDTAIPFCLHFAPRNINLVGLQQYLQSVQRSFVFEAMQLNLRDFELNESVARALTELVMFGAKISCLQLPLKSTDFLSEDECPRQPLADCLLAVTGGGPRTRLFSTVAEQPYYKAGSHRSKVETIVVNDVDIDDRRFAALCSTLRGASNVRELVLESVFTQDARERRALKWKWLAYALFTPTRYKTSVKKLAITESQLLVDDVVAISSLVSTCNPAQELFDPLWAEHEASQRVKQSNKSQDNDQPKWETSKLEEMVQLKKDTVVYLEPLCTQEEWLQSSVVLEQDAEFALMSANDEWLEVLVPGYGKCWVDPRVAHDRYVSNSESYNWRGITDLSLVTQVAKSSTDKVLIQFFQLIGHDLVNLVLHTNLLREQGLGSILRSCPNLKRLELNGAQVEDMFVFTHGYDVGYCQLEALAIERYRVRPRSLKEFAKVLSDADREAARHIRELCIGKVRLQDIDVAIAEYETMIEAFARMLDTNRTLEVLRFYVQGDFYTRFVKSFTAHNGEQLPAEELSKTRKLAFISALDTAKKTRLEGKAVRLIFKYAARRVTREISILNY